MTHPFWVATEKGKWPVAASIETVAIFHNFYINQLVNNFSQLDEKRQISGQ